MKTTYRIGVAAAVLLWAIASPVQAQNKEHQQMAATLQMLQEQQQQLATALAQLAQWTKTVDTRLDALDGASRKGFADHKLVIDGMGTDLRAVRGRVDDSNDRLQSLREEVDAIRTSLLALAQAQMQIRSQTDGQTSSDPSIPSAPLPAPSLANVGESPLRLYQTAFSDYASGSLPLAIQGFEAFIRSNANSDKADDAQFFIGEAYLLQTPDASRGPEKAADRQARLTNAVNAYTQVIKRYPTGDQVSLAYYKLGLAQTELGQTAAARESWETVVKTFPDSDGALLAKEKLETGSKPAAAPPGRVTR